MASPRLPPPAWAKPACGSVPTAWQPVPVAEGGAWCCEPRAVVRPVAPPSREATLRWNREERGGSGQKCIALQNAAESVSKRIGR
jgi:hypothetical protein